MADEVNEVRINVYGWVDSWQKGDIESYMSFYHPAFRSGEYDFNIWLERKAEAFKRPGPITVKLTDLSVIFDNNIAYVKFLQHYKDGLTSDVGEKELILEKSNRQWKIIHEEWTAIKEKKSRIIEEDLSPSQKLKKKKPEQKKREPPPAPPGMGAKNLLITKMEFNAEKERETVLIHFNRLPKPVFFTLNGSRPRVVVDIKKVFNKEFSRHTSVNGRFVKAIRAFKHRNPDKLRIVLDLVPGKDYQVGEIHHPEGNLYGIEVIEVIQQ